MAEIFLTYKVERRAAARWLAKTLRLYGFSVWYEHGRVAGEEFADSLRQEFDEAQVVLGLWCPMSVRSEWVLGEARRANAGGRLLSCIIQPVAPPTAFSATPQMDLTGWDGAPRSDALAALLEAISARIGRDPAADGLGLMELEQDWIERGRPSIAELSVQPAFATRSQLAALLAPPQPIAQTEEASAPSSTPAPQGLDPAHGGLWARAEAGDAVAQFEIGRLYEQGLGGLPKDLGAAFARYQIAAAQGNAEAQCSLGALLQIGAPGLVRDEAEAARLYRRAADQGLARAQTALGRMLQAGLGGLLRDDAAAVRLYRKASDQGYAPAHACLGWMYETGAGGLARDEEEAIRLYRLAASRGDANAQHALGMIYARRGKGG